MASSLQRTIDTIARDARAAAATLATASEVAVNRALRAMARLLHDEQEQLRRENERDLAAARDRSLPPAMLERLTLSDKALRSMTGGLRALVRLRSSVGRVELRRRVPSGLLVSRVRVPIGVVAIIYESRPNVTVDAAAICLKSRNAVILRGGSEAFHSNRALGWLFARALDSAGLPPQAVQLVPTTDRKAVDLLLAKQEHIDLVIPRGGEGLIRAVVEKSRIPVIKHYKGVCHTFVSRHADLRIALPVVVNAKVQRPGVCNAMETLLLDRGLPRSAQLACLEALLEQGVTLIGDQACRSLLPGRVQAATEADWYAEYLDLRLAVRLVDGLDEAIGHINTYGSHHTDAIITRDRAEARSFTGRVDSASVMVNTSTRFADGGEYGMGCEIGISTDKLHARGPMGIDELTTYKWVVEGKGQLRR